MKPCRGDIWLVNLNPVKKIASLSTDEMKTVKKLFDELVG